MATSQLSDYADLFMDNYGELIVQAFTETGLIPGLSILGRFQAKGLVNVGGAEGASDENVAEWGVDTAGLTATPHDVNTTFSTASTDVYGKASIPWRRNHITMSWDNLMSVLDVPVRGGGQALSISMRKRLNAILNTINANLYLDGTGNSSLDFSGFKAFLSLTNTYAGISQSSASYWQATNEAGGTATLTETMLENLVGSLYDDGNVGADTEMWMNRNQWIKYKALYSGRINMAPGEAGGTNIQPMYNDGTGVNIPIYILPDMPTTEIWVVNLKQGEIGINFADHAPKAAVPGVDPDESVMHEGVPIGFEEVKENKDQKTVVMKCYGNLWCKNPREQGYLDAITA